MKLSVHTIPCILLSVFLSMVFLALETRSVSAQIQAAPTALYMDHENRTGRMVLRNSSDQQVEVEIELIYGYPATNEMGEVYFRYVDTLGEESRSAVDWMRVYPPQLVIPPGGQQTVRFAARPPAELPQGEYWVRPAIVSFVPVAIDQHGGGISTQINLQQRTILAINYRNGQVSTGVTASNLSASYDEGKLTLSADLERLGNAAWLGHYRIRLIDEAGIVLDTIQREIAVYKDQKRAFRLDSPGLPHGSYTVELQLTTDERDKEGILQTSPIQVTTSMDLH